MCILSGNPNPGKPKLWGHESEKIFLKTRQIAGLYLFAHSTDPDHQQTSSTGT